MKRLYWVWAAMIQRCENPKNKGYCNYGARGITVCPTWRNSFAQFVQDLGMPPKGMSIERIDNIKDIQRKLSLGNKASTRNE